MLMVVCQSRVGRSGGTVHCANHSARSSTKSGLVLLNVNHPSRSQIERTEPDLVKLHLAHPAVRMQGA